MLGILLADPARTQIEHLLVVDPPYRRPVTAFHVVGIDFKLRLGIHFRQFTEQQIIVGHLAISFNSVLSDVDQAIEYRPPLIADDRFMQLAAVAISFVMLKPGAGVADFIFHRHCQAVEPKRGVFAVKLGAGVMTQHRITE